MLVMIELREWWNGINKSQNYEKVD